MPDVPPEALDALGRAVHRAFVTGEHADAAQLRELLAMLREKGGAP